MKLIRQANTLKQKGFTLIEFLIYMGILSILVTVLTSIFFSILDSSLASQSLSSIQQDGRYILLRMDYDIHQAQSVTAPIIGANGSTLQLVINGVTNTYTVDGSQNLNVSNGSGTIQLNGYNTSVSNLSFSSSGNSGGKTVVKISYTLTSRTTHASGKNSQNFQETVSMR